MDLLSKVSSEITRISEIVMKDQSSDGSWRYCLENDPSTDAYMIMLLRSLKVNEEEIVRSLAARIASLQGDDATWRLFQDEEGGNLSSTLISYNALLFSGHSMQTDEHMQAAKNFILKNGGVEMATPLTKVMLAIAGQYPWPPSYLIPLEVILFPRSFPFNFFDFVGYARVHMAPILVVGKKQFSVKTSATPDLTSLYVSSIQEISTRTLNLDKFRRFFQLLQRRVRDLPHLPEKIEQTSYQKMEQFMVERIEPDGTLYSYTTSTIPAIYAFQASGMPNFKNLSIQAIQGLKKMMCNVKGNLHMQNTTATVWNTALLSYALQEAGVSHHHSSIKKAGSYLLSRQQSKYGDWALKNPGVEPGGWGFSDINTINPDIDDTTAALRALHGLRKDHSQVEHSIKRGIRWFSSMQNEDGGWSAFEKNTNKELLHWIPIEGFDSVATDPSSVDLTGRALEYLGNFQKQTVRKPSISKAVRWIMRHQERDGSWYGRWGICYIYGTWAALTGMIAVGISSNHPAIQKAVNWLESNQNPDGGWGESCRSDSRKQYVPLGVSTLSQTAWALDALIAASSTPTPTINKGIAYLADTTQHHPWATSYPTGAGLPGQFYFHYHSYQYIWPLVALGHYKKKYSS